MSDKLVVDVDSSDAVLATKQMEALTGAVISMGEAFKSAKGSTSALKELRALLVGLKGKGSAFDELSAAIKDLNRNSDLLRGSFETSIGQLNRTLKSEMAELKAQLRTDALEAGRQMGNGLEEGLKEADAKVKRQGRTLAATAKAEATRVYEAMVAGQANAKVKDPATLFKLEEAGATLSPYHKQVLANWKRSSAETFRALKEQLKQENAEIAATVKAEEAALQMALKGMEERSNLRSASLADIYAGSLRRGKQNISSVKTALKEQATEVAATVKAEETALQMALKSMEERSAIRATSMADIYARSLVRGRQSIARVKEELRTQAAELAAAVAAQNATVAKQVQAATNAPVGVYQRYNASTGAAGGIVNPKDAENLSKTSKLLKAFTLDANDAHSAARGLASGFGLLWLTWGNMVPLLAGAAISHSFATIVKSGSEVQHNLTQIKTLAGATGAEVQGLSDQMLNLARTGPYAPREIAEAMKTLALAGLNAKETYAAIPEVLNFAVAGTTSVKEAADALTTVGTAFNITADNYSYISDVISKTAAESKSSVESISEAFKTASVINQQYGVSLEDTAVGLALLANAGIQGSAAGTALRNMYADLAGRTPKVAQALKQLGVEAIDPLTGKMKDQATVFNDMIKELSRYSATDQSEFLRRIFSERGSKEAIAILNALRKTAKETGSDVANAYEELAQKIADSAGFASVAAAELSLTPLNQMKQVATTLEATFVEVFASLQPFILETSKSLQQLFASQNFKEGLRDIAITVANLTTFLVENTTAIATAVAGYIGFKGVMIAAGAVTTMFATAAATATTGVTGLALAMQVLTKGNPLLLALSGILTVVSAGWAIYAANAKRGTEATETYTSSTADQLLEALEKEEERLRRVNEAREAGISLQELEAKLALTKAQNDEPLALKKAREKLEAIPQKPQYSAVAGNADPFASARLEAERELNVELEKHGATLLKIKQTTESIARLRTESANAAKEQSRAQIPETGTDSIPTTIRKEREQRLRIQNDNELKQIEARLKAELNLNTTYYSAEKSQLEARYNANILSVAEYQSEYTRLTKEAEQKRIAIYGEASGKYDAALADRFSAMQQAFTSQIKGSQVSTELQGIIAGVNASLKSGEQAYSDYYEAAAAGDYSAQETLAASLYNSKTALDAYIESLKEYVEMQPEGPAKKLAAEMLNAAQAAATFQQANADAIQGSHVKMVEDARKAYYDLAKTVGEASRSSEEFWKKERNELAEQKAVEALEQQYRFLNESVFSSDVATKAAALAREKAISKYRQEMVKLNTAAQKAEDAVNSWATEYGAAIASGNKEAIKTLEQLIELRDKMNGDRADFVAEAATSTEDLTLAAFEKARREQIEAWSSELGDAIQTSIFEGGKAGGEKFIAILRRELLTKPLQAFINATINAVTGGLMNGIVGGAASGFASSMFGSALGSVTGNWLGAGSAMGMLGNIGAGVTTGLGTLFTEGFGAWISQATGLMGAGSMGGGLGALLGPIGLLGSAALLLSSFDKSGTPHYGAVAEYEGGKVVGTEQMFYTNAGVAGRYSKGAQPGVNAVAMGAGGVLDAVDKIFGGKGGFKVRTAYSDDSSDDPGFGSLRIERDGRKIVDWEDTRTSRWAARVFADGEEGVKLYMQAVAKDVRQAMLDMDLPSWADKMLTELGDTATIEQLAATVQQIGVINTAFEQLGHNMAMFANITGELQGALLEAAGGIDALVNSAGAFYQGFYSEAERMESLRGQLNTTLSGFDLSIDPNLGDDAKAQFRAAVESAMAAGNAELAAALLAMSGNFATAADYFEQLSQTAAEAAKKAAEDAAKALKDQINSVHDMLRRAIDRDRSSLQAQATAINSTISAITSAINTLKSNARDLYGEVNSTQQMLAAQGMVYIEDALAGVRAGASVADYTGLSDAISAARGGLKGKGYVSEFARQRDTLVLAGRLSELGELGDMQLSIEERQLRAINEQIEYLDTLAKRADDMVNGTAALTGTVASYFGQLMSLLDGNGSTGTPTTPEGGYGGVQGGGVQGGTAAPRWQYGQGYQGTPERFTEEANYGFGRFTMDVVDAARNTFLSSLRSMLQAEYGSGSAEDLARIADKAKAMGATMGDIGSALGFWREDIVKMFAGVGIPAFEVGINRVPHDMVARIHKDEAILPAEYNPFNPNAVQWGGSGADQDADLAAELAVVVAELQALRAQVASVQASTAATATNTAQLDDNIDRYTNGGTYSRQRAI